MINKKNINIVATVLMILFVFIGSMLIADLIKTNYPENKKPQTVAESVINNIQKHPQEWTITKISDSLRFSFIYDNGFVNTGILENKKCGITLYLNHFGCTTLTMITPDTLEFDGVEVIHILAAYETAIEEPKRKQDSIKQAHKKQRILNIVNSCNK